MTSEDVTSRERARMTRGEFAALRREMLTRTVPELIVLLASDRLATRFIAEMILRDKTNV